MAFTPFQVNRKWVLLSHLEVSSLELDILQRLTYVGQKKGADHS